MIDSEGFGTIRAGKLSCAHAPSVASGTRWPVGQRRRAADQSLPSTGQVAPPSGKTTTPARSPMKSRARPMAPAAPVHELDEGQPRPSGRRDGGSQ